MTERKAKKCVFHGKVYDSITEGKIAAFLFFAGASFYPKGKADIRQNGFICIPDFFVKDVEVVRPNCDQVTRMDLCIEAKGEGWLSDAKTLNRYSEIKPNFPFYIMTRPPIFEQTGASSYRLSCPCSIESDPKRLAFNLKTVLGTDEDCPAMIGISKETGCLIICPVEVYDRFIDTRATADALRQATSNEVFDAVEGDGRFEQLQLAGRNSSAPVAKAEAPAVASSQAVFKPEYGPMPISARQAGYIADHYFYEQQRAISKPHVKRLINQMRVGHFKDSTLIFCHVAENGRVILIDGQHRMTALRSFALGENPHPDFAVTFDVLVKEVQNEDEVWKRYQEQSNNPLARRDVLNAKDRNAKTRKEQGDIDLVYNAAKMAETSLRRAPKNDPISFDNEYKLEVCKKRWQKFGFQFLNIVKEGEKNISGILRNTSIVATAMILLEAQPKEAEDFWKKVADPPKKGKNTAVPKDLHYALIRNENRTYKQKIALCVSAWNKFFSTGEESKKMKIDAFYDYLKDGSIMGVEGATEDRRSLKPQSLLELL